jgi:heme-degrading monooxygenase HmoA
MKPLLVTAEFVFTEEGEVEYLRHLDRTLAEVRGIEGCLQAVMWTRPERRFQFSTLWSDAEAVTRWVENEFHRTVLMPGFRRWCTEGCFGDYRLETDHQRARKCPSCGRWTQGLPGWDERQPASCEKCGASLEQPAG